MASASTAPKLIHVTKRDVDTKFATLDPEREPDDYKLLALIILNMFKADVEMSPDGVLCSAGLDRRVEDHGLPARFCAPGWLFATPKDSVKVSRDETARLRRLFPDRTVAGVSSVVSSYHKALTVSKEIDPATAVPHPSHQDIPYPLYTGGTSDEGYHNLCTYPYILVEHYPYNKWIPYSAYHFQAQYPMILKLTNKFRLPLIDHIDRDVSVSDRDRLRYCTDRQNVYNRCSERRSKQPNFHGCSPSKNDWSMGALAVGYHQQAFPVVLVWTNILFNAFKTGALPRSPVPREEDLHIFTTNSCRAWDVDGLGQHVEFIDKFVYQLLQMLSREYVVQHSTQYKALVEDPSMLVSQAIPRDHYQSYDALVHLMMPFHTDSTSRLAISKSFKPKWFAALANDIFRSLCHGSFRHTNFFRPLCETTCARVLEAAQANGSWPTPLMTPVQVLNFWEPYYDQALLDKEFALRGLPAEVKGKRCKYEVGGNFDHIRAVFVDDVVAKDPSTAFPVHENNDETIARSHLVLVECSS